MPAPIPAGTPATGGTDTTSGATSTTVQSQGPNDPLNGPATEPTTAPATGATEGGSADGGAADIERRLRNMEEATRRMAQERDEARRLLEEARRQALPDDERARLTALDQQLAQQRDKERSLILRYEIASRAPKLGIVDPEIAVLLLERNGNLNVTDSGEVEGLDEALRQLVKDKPHLVRATNVAVDAGAGASGGGGRPKQSMNEFIRAASRGPRA